MQKVIDQRTGKKSTVFNKYKLDGLQSCPECGRPLDSNDLFVLEECGKRSCKKCGAVLTK